MCQRPAPAHSGVGWGGGIVHVLGVTALLTHAKKCFVLFFFFLIFIYLFWLCRVLVVTRGSLLLRVLSSCGVQT